MMTKSEIPLLQSLLLTHQPKPIPFFEEGQEKAFYPFLALEILHLLDEMDFFQGTTPLLESHDSLPDESCLTLDITLTLNKTDFHGRLLLSSSLQRSWTQHLQKQKGPTLSAEKLEAVTVGVQLQAGKVTLPRKEWLEIEQGDFIPLDTCSLKEEFSEGRVVLTLNEKPLFRGKIKEGNCKILEYPIFQEENTMEHDEEFSQEEETSFEEEETELEEEGEEEEETEFEEEEEEETELEEEGEEEKEEEEEEEETHIKPLPSTEAPVEPLFKPEDIPLTLVVEAGRLNMSVAQLMQLEPGNLLELDIHPENGVDLTVQGKCVAKAELIQIGDVLGVRILEKG